MEEALLVGIHTRRWQGFNNPETKLQWAAVMAKQLRMACRDVAQGLCKRPTAAWLRLLFLEQEEEEKVEVSEQEEALEGDDEHAEEGREEEAKEGGRAVKSMKMGCKALTRQFTSTR